MPTAHQIAALARLHGMQLTERITLHADALVDALARQLELVAWDREQLVGQLQQRVTQLLDERPRVREGPPVRVIERRSQPLEAIEAVWSWLRHGRPVRLQLEPDACTAAAELLEDMVSLFPEGVLEVDDGIVAPDEALADGGVDTPGRRIAVIDSDADRELAAYVLARTGLRRNGVDPRAVKIAYAVGDLELLQRHMRRLWVGVRVGPADDPDSFMGPVLPQACEAFLEAHAQWKGHDAVETWCPGGRLHRAGDSHCYIAPALFGTQWPAPELPCDGPMVVVVACDDDAQLREAAEAARKLDGQVVQIGGRPGLVRHVDRHVRGALLVERLPPGMPEPRPV
ncbi:MAG: hypothetical protein K0V04_19760 [Deltaproteobacteria bacterium]|nr:hypothetical protein [Deltaproteobacteria bacterium]